MADATSGQNDIQELKRRIKQWEKQFEQANGRKPCKEDISSEKDIAKLYKLYRQSKRTINEPKSSAPSGTSVAEPANATVTDKHSELSVESHKSHSINAIATPTKARRKLDFDAFVTPTKQNRNSRRAPARKPETLPAAVPDSDSEFSDIEQIKEVGPTPQLYGRTLGLFDITLSPLTTPTKRKPRSTENQQLRTPEKPELPKPGLAKLSPVRNSTEPFLTPAKTSSPLKLKLLMSTPTKKQQGSASLPQGKLSVSRQSPVDATPVYMRSTAIQDLTTSPSPLASFRVKRGLSEILQELREMQDHMYDEEEAVLRDIEEMQALEAQEAQEAQSDAEGDNPGLDSGKKWKKKGQKRTTRRYILKPVPVMETTKEETQQTDLGAEEPGEIGEMVPSDIEDEGEKEKPKPARKGRARKFNLVSDNFRRLKIHKPKNFRRFRR